MALCAKEMKNIVASSSLGLALTKAKVDVVRCEVGDEVFRHYVPKEHVAQVLHQQLVLDIRYVIYVPASEIVFLYIVIF